MKLLRPAAAAASLSAILVLSGCATSQPSSSGSSRTADGGCPTGEVVARETQVSRDHLIQLGDMLRQQGRYQKAAETYSWALQSNPGNQTARNRLQQLPGNLGEPYLQAAQQKQHQQQQQTPQAQASQPQKSQPMPMPAQQQPAQASRPSAPPPPIDIPNAGRPPVPAAPPAEAGPATAREERKSPTPGPLQRADSNRSSTTVVAPPGEQMKFEKPANDGPHEIQILPATRGSARSRQSQQSSRDAAPTAVPTPMIIPSDSKRTAAHAATETPVGRLLFDLNRRAETPAAHVDEASKSLSHASPQVRSMAAYLLGHAGSAAADLKPQLTAALESETDGPTRVRLAEALLRIDPESETALKTLEESLDSTSMPVRWEAVCVVQVLVDHPEREQAIRRLLERLNDRDEDVRAMAALKLGEFRSDAPQLVPELDTLNLEPDLDGKLRVTLHSTLQVLRGGNY